VATGALIPRNCHQIIALFVDSIFSAISRAKESLPVISTRMSQKPPQSPIERLQVLQMSVDPSCPLCGSESVSQLDSTTSHACHDCGEIYPHISGIAVKMGFVDDMAELDQLCKGLLVEIPRLPARKGVRHRRIQWLEGDLSCGEIPDPLQY
jgi:hypothetical protein